MAASAHAAGRSSSLSGSLGGWDIGPTMIANMFRHACADIGVLSFLVRDYVEVVVANTCGFVCWGGRGFLPNQLVAHWSAAATCRNLTSQEFVVAPRWRKCLWRVAIFYLMIQSFLFKRPIKRSTQLVQNTWKGHHQVCSVQTVYIFWINIICTVTDISGEHNSRITII